MTETPMLKGVRDNPDLTGALEAIPVPLNRTANVDEIANVIVLMVSDAFSFMHGSVLYVDGGTDAVVRPNQF
ncbi:MAG: SDR family oxidoreductase, partial [Pseudomonadota bacterium]|nr:SDR family oxidoreductase [Pseudomonadota bacterium]